MSQTELTFQATLPFPVSEVFSWHNRPGAFERLNPPWNPVQVIAHTGAITDGSMVKLKVTTPIGIPITWGLMHSGFRENEQFIDLQTRGPFRSWQHRHLFKSTGAQSTTLDDCINFELPVAPLSDLLVRPHIERELARLFCYRHVTTRNDLSKHSQYRGTQPLKIAIAGGSGLIGRGLAALLRGGGHTVKILSRRSSPDQIHWDPSKAQIDLDALEGTDVIVNLAGENIAGERWTESFKEKLFESRVLSTRLITSAISKLKTTPKVLVSASAIGVYQSNTANPLSEEGEIGTGFLPELVTTWEEEALAAQTLGVRVVLPRIGIVMSPRGGALSKMLAPFLLALGGIVGSGNQMMSWISYDDALYGLYAMIADQNFSGPVNLTAPNPVSNREFTKTLGKVLKRPTIFPLPAAIVEALFGEMGRALLLNGLNVLPRKLLDHGFKFTFPTLDSCLKHQLGRL